MEFVVKKKTAKITIDGMVHEFAMPTVADAEEILEAVKGKAGMDVFHSYDKFFNGLGLPVALSKHMDAQDYVDFISMVLNPKKKE